MNRNSSQLQMHAAVAKQRQLLRASMVGNTNDSIRSKEREDEHLALFMEMKKSEKDQNDLLVTNPNYFDSPLEIYPSPDSNPEIAPMYTMPPPSVAPVRKTGADDFLNSENDKSDYDWLLTPPGTPLFPSLDMESQKSIMSQISSPKGRLSSLKSLGQIEAISSRSSNNAAKQTLSSSPSSSASGLRRPSSSGGPSSRPSTPTRNSFPSANKPTRSSTPTARPSLSAKPGNSSPRPSIATSKRTPAAKVPSSSSSSGPKQAPRVSSSSSVNSIPSPSPLKSSTRLTAAARSSTPTRSAPPRSSTPTSRPSIPPKIVPQSSTPTRKPPSASVASVKSLPSASKTPSVSSRGISPSAQPRSWKPAEMPGYTHDAPPNLRTTPPARPAIGARGRAGPPSSRSSSIEPASNGRMRRQSCSPSRGRAPVQPSGGSVPALNRLYAKANDHISPALVGTKMVERVINMRKLAPPRPDGKLSPNTTGKSSSSPDSNGFGRTISKKSLDMAIRHMDIRRALPGNLRPLMAKVPASSMYSVRAGPTRIRGVGVNDSPVATSSNASSDVSNTGAYLDHIEFEDDFGEREGRSPLRGR